jgi:hypothetical protein
VVEYKKAQEKELLHAAVNIERENELLRVTVNRKGDEYVYETDNFERMSQKVNDLSSSK